MNVCMKAVLLVFSKRNTTLLQFIIIWSTFLCRTSAACILRLWRKELQLRLFQSICLKKKHSHQEELMKLVIYLDIGHFHWTFSSHSYYFRKACSSAKLSLKIFAFYPLHFRLIYKGLDGIVMKWNHFILLRSITVSIFYYDSHLCCAESHLFLTEQGEWKSAVLET